MTRHLTEKELIEYQFKLASENRAEEVSSHLKTCDQCRQEAEQLKRRFVGLDLLREETKVSDKLISKTIEQCQRGTKSRILSLRTSSWISAAAAVLLIGAMLLVSDLGRDKKQGRQIAEDISPVEEEVKLDGTLDVAFDSDLNKEELLAKKLRTDVRVVAGVAAKPAEAEELEKPPFVPASAIELVTLPRRDNVQITIYNSADLTLVRERRNLTLKKGWNWLQFMWANTLIDPTSLSLEPIEQAGKIDIQQLVFPARLKDIGRWLIRSKTEGKVQFEVTYFTSGLSWRAFYMGTLSIDERKMKLQGYVRVANRSGEDYENAQTRLIVGKVHQLDKIAELAKRQYPYNRPGEPRRDRYGGVEYDVEKEKGDVILNSNGAIVGGLFKGLKPKEIKKEGLSEYFLYTIEGTETIPDKWGKRLLSFETEDIDVNSLYKYDEQRWGKQAIRFLAFTNDEEHNLGDTPIPNGNVRIYSQADVDGHLSYVGRTSVKYIPVDEEVELNLGSARQVCVEPILIDFKTSNFLFDTKGNIDGWDETRKWKVEVTNTRNLPVEIEITRGFSTAYWTLEYNGEAVSYEKYDATHARFKTKLQPQSKRTFTYTVTTYHGRREEQANR